MRCPVRISSWPGLLNIHIHFWMQNKGADGSDTEIEEIEIEVEADNKGDADQAQDNIGTVLVRGGLVCYVSV